MNAAQRRPLPGNRWHFQHGPIDCVIGADGDADAVAQALGDAWTRFQGVLRELVAELPLLRANLAARERHRVDAAGDAVDPGPRVKHGAAVRRDDEPRGTDRAAHGRCV